MKTDILCDMLLFFATSSEKEELRNVAKKMEIPFHRKNDKRLGRYYSLGQVGDFKINAVQTEMGALSHYGSASKGILYKIATGATSIIQIGMAFGTIPSKQTLGDVLVSSCIIPYDRKDVSGSKTKWIFRKKKYVVDYSPAKRHPVMKSLLNIFQKSNRNSDNYKVHVGAILSGSARIRSKYFRDELVSSIPPGDDLIVGGEMEGFGLLSISPPDEPIWIVIKGISDFADEFRDDVIEEGRQKACSNAAEFVLKTLVEARHTEKGEGKCQI